MSVIAAVVSMPSTAVVMVSASVTVIATALIVPSAVGLAATVPSTITVEFVSAMEAFTSAKFISPVAIVEMFIAPAETVSIASVIAASIVVVIVVAIGIVTIVETMSVVCVSVVLRMAVIVVVPRSGAYEDTIDEPIGAPIAVRRTRVRGRWIVSIRAHWRCVVGTVNRPYPNSNRNLCLRINRGKR